MSRGLSHLAKVLGVAQARLDAVLEGIASSLELKLSGRISPADFRKLFDAYTADLKSGGTFPHEEVTQHWPSRLAAIRMSQREQGKRARRKAQR
jgi:hypothetical protein